MLVDKKAAKEILNLYRPGRDDKFEGEFAEALEFAKNDPELSRWFQEHCALYQAVRAKFEGIPVPPGLREQILSEQPGATGMGRRATVAAICVVAMLLAAGLWAL